MKRNSKRIVSVFLSFVLIAMLIPLSGIIATAEVPETIDVYSEQAGYFVTYNLKNDKLPDGMEWDDENGRLILNGYNGTIISATGPGGKIEIYVYGTNTINGDSFGCLNFGEVILKGSPDAVLNLHGKNRPIYRVELDVYDVQLNIKADDQDGEATCSGMYNSSVTLNGSAKLSVNVKRNISSGARVYGLIDCTLTVKDEATVDILVDGIGSTYDVSGLNGSNLNLQGKGEVYIETKNDNGDGKSSVGDYYTTITVDDLSNYTVVGAKGESILRYVPAPKLLEGEASKWTSGSATGLSFKSSARFGDLREVKVDGAEVSSENYTHTSGSTVVTLKQSFLESLKVGAHQIAITSIGGTVTANFEILASPEPTATTVGTKPVAADTIAPTGDMNNVVSQLALVVALGGLAVAAGVARRKEEK